MRARELNPFLFFSSRSVHCTEQRGAAKKKERENACSYVSRTAGRVQMKEGLSVQLNRATASAYAGELYCLSLFSSLCVSVCVCGRFLENRAFRMAREL